jgi:hypothetical protein
MQRFSCQWPVERETFGRRSCRKVSNWFRFVFTAPTASSINVVGRDLYPRLTDNRGRVHAFVATFSDINSPPLKRLSTFNVSRRRRIIAVDASQKLNRGGVQTETRQMPTVNLTFV